MSITPNALQALFASTSGADPVFNVIDGANCPTVATGSTSGHSLLLNSGLIRIALTLPAAAQFTITTLNDPYGCATTLNTGGQQVVSVYRRPLPTASLPLPLQRHVGYAPDPLTTQQRSHAERRLHYRPRRAAHRRPLPPTNKAPSPPTAAQTSAILTLEQGLFTAQATDTLAGSLSANGATGGPSNLAAQPYYPGINDTFGGDPTGAKFNPVSMTLFTAWANSTNPQQALHRARTEPLQHRSYEPHQRRQPACAAGWRCEGVLQLLPRYPQHRQSFSTPAARYRRRAPHWPPRPTPTSSLVSRNSPPRACPRTRSLAARLPPEPPSPMSPPTPAKRSPPVYALTSTCKNFPPCAASPHGLLTFITHRPTTLTQLVNFYNARFQMNLNAGQKADLVSFLSAL